MESGLRRRGSYQRDRRVKIPAGSRDVVILTAEQRVREPDADLIVRPAGRDDVVAVDRSGDVPIHVRREIDARGIVAKRIANQSARTSDERDGNSSVLEDELDVRAASRSSGSVQLLQAARNRRLRLSNGREQQDQQEDFKL